MKEIVRDAKFEDEDEMLRKYGVHMKLMKELDELLAKGNSWKDLLDNAQEGQELKVRRKNKNNSSGIEIGCNGYSLSFLPLPFLPSPFLSSSPFPHPGCGTVSNWRDPEVFVHQSEV